MVAAGSIVDRPLGILDRNNSNVTRSKKPKNARPVTDEEKIIA